MIDIVRVKSAAVPISGLLRISLAKAYLEISTSSVIQCRFVSVKAKGLAIAEDHVETVAGERHRFFDR